MRIFVAHPFADLPIADYRDAYNAVQTRLAARENLDLRFDFADGARVADSSHILEEITQLIVEADAAICDITTMNPNVMLECGIVRATGTVMALLVKSPVDALAIPADLQGFQRRQYTDRRELEVTLETVVRSLREQANASVQEPAALVAEYVDLAADELFEILNQSENELRISELSDVTGLDQALVRELAKLLFDTGRIYRVGEGPGTRYGPNEVEEA